jgi:hypothetical protein
MLIATDYTILRGVIPGKGNIALEREPIRLGTLVNEALFESSGHEILQFRTVLLEERMHDWDWSHGQLRYHTGSRDACDVLLVFAEKEVLFCTQCGAKKDDATLDPCEACKKV